MRPLIESKGFILGQGYFLVYSPEREDPGNTTYSTKTIPKVCGAETPTCLNIGVILYGSIIDTAVPVSSIKTAEMTKLLENIYRAVNIGLVNEIKSVADKLVMRWIAIEIVDTFIGSSAHKANAISDTPLACNSDLFDKN
ncbi:MAG: UDP-N-acetyl-D-glucosamine dehydrogenase [Zhongshania sp.]|jgi:UDP-N-acetyl-D-glucosamine dehydrogenase